MKGSRVQAVVQELRGEKIDIVPYDDDPARFVCNAIAPAEVSRVIIDAEGHRMELIVPDDKLSLAIGKKGQNVRLASQLTGWRIDIHSESKIYELERRAKEQIAQAIDAAGFDTAVADTLFKLGWRSVGELGRAHVEELAGLPGISGPDGARKIIDSAQLYMASGGRRRDDARKEAERRGHMSGTQQLLELDGVDEDVLNVLATANIHSPEDLIKTPIESIATSTGIDMGDLARLRQRAISWLSEVSS
jgi:N utilization substance protein A